MHTVSLTTSFVWDQPNVNGLKMAFGASPCSHAAGEWMFEHREAVTTQLGGETIDHSLIRPAHLAPCHDIRYSRRPAEPSGASNSRTHLVVCTCGSGRLAGV